MTDGEFLLLMHKGQPKPPKSIWTLPREPIKQALGGDLTRHGHCGNLDACVVRRKVYSREERMRNIFISGAARVYISQSHCKLYGTVSVSSDTACLPI